MSKAQYRPPRSVLSGYTDFWLRFEVSPEKLKLFRFLFFALLALDAWLQIAHAPRYGYGDFNVSHFPLLDSLLPLPTRQAMITLYVVQAYLAFRIALGGVGRVYYIALALLFAGGYFISQLNSYQHHYLLAIVLGLFCLFPWPDTSCEKSSGPSTLATRSNWPVRMLLVAMSAMYFFAVVSKLDGEWSDGSTLQIQLQEGFFEDLGNWLGWKNLATLTLMSELALCFLIHVRRLWPLTMIAGMAMHLSFEFAGLDIGLFSYFMVVLYLLLLPETWIQRLATNANKCKTRLSFPSISLGKKAFWSWATFGLSLLITALLWLSVPIQSTLSVLLIIGALALVDVFIQKGIGRSALLHFVAIALLVLVSRNTNSLRDYYRYWGGNERRSGNVEQAIAAYERVVEIDPDYAGGRSNLGKLYRREKRDEEALLQFEAGMKSSATHFGVHLGAAQIYHKQSRGDLALRAAEVAVKLKPKSKSARTIRDYWRQKTNNNAPTR